MTMRTAMLGALLALAVALAAACSNSHSHPSETAAPAARPWRAPQTAEPPAEVIPPYFETAEAAKPYPPLMLASFFRSNPMIARGYRTAGRYPAVVAQQPCYCHCDRIGHRSLLDCYAGEHAAGCAICLQEVLLVGQMVRQAKSAQEIRKAIIRGDWRKISLGSAGGN